MKFIEWVGVGIVVLLLWGWLRRGGASSLTQSWGSGMVYAPNGAWRSLPQFQSYIQNSDGSVKAQTGPPWWAGINVGYAPDSGFSAGYGL